MARQRGNAARAICLLMGLVMQASPVEALEVGKAATVGTQMFACASKTDMAAYVLLAQAENYAAMDRMRVEFTLAGRCVDLLPGMAIIVDRIEGGFACARKAHGNTPECLWTVRNALRD